jgi:voltage-gated potassium channel
MTESADQHEEKRHPRSAGRARWVRDNYGLVLVWTLLMLVILAVLGDLRTGRALGVILLGGLFLLTLRASSVGRRGFLIASTVVIVAFIAAIVAAAAGATTAARAVTVILSAAFVIASPVVIVRRLIHHPEVSARTILGAMCVFVFIGLFFAFVFIGYDLMRTDPFFAQTSEPRSVDYLYYSLSTLTTLGYGDLSPVSDLGRMTAALEAMIGQLYLVTVIALLVGNLGRKRGAQ